MGSSSIIEGLLMNSFEVCNKYIAIRRLGSLLLKDVGSVFQCGLIHLCLSFLTRLVALESLDHGYQLVLESLDHGYQLVALELLDHVYHLIRL